MRGLDALENICNQCEHYQFEKGLRPKKCPFNKSCVFKKRVEKELKALEIIKKKRVIMTWIYDCKSIHEYNSLVIGKYMLTAEEYELLKEVLL